MSNDRVVLVGGSMGALGSAMTRVFLEDGATVGALYMGTPPPAHERVIPLEADLTDTAAVARAVTSLLAEAGRIDILVNAAGGFAAGKVIDTTDEAWDRQLALNLKIPIILSRAVLPHMTARGEGRIWHVAARAARHPFPGAAAYVVSKTALLGLIRVLALELAGTGVTANAILPGTLDTPANREGMPNADTSRWVPTEELARILLGLCSPESRHLNGETIVIG
ncbi:MAG TPA: SDR family NAD(P)-dependent oxidoreductase [Candidatus Eisenbacteria bacterium]